MLQAFPRGILGAQDQEDSSCQVQVDNTTKTVKVVTSHDPNAIYGPPGVGAQRFISTTTPLLYDVTFENVVSATAPAQTVVITDWLDPTRMDLSTFSLGTIVFGSKVVSPPAGHHEFSTRVDLRPQNNLIVQVDAQLNLTTGVASWAFTSIDPATQAAPEDPLVGFLPPNTTPPQGQGSVFFTVMPSVGLSQGTPITNQAHIVFDINPAISTDVWTNTVDAASPTSTVSALPTYSLPAFAVSWSGNDSGGSGIAAYDVYTADNGGPFTLWQTGVTGTRAILSGIVGHTYAFYSVATDNVGNLQATPAGAQASTTTRAFIYLPLVLRQ